MNFQSLFPPLLTAPCLALFNADLGKKKKRGRSGKRRSEEDGERERERRGGGGLRVVCAENTLFGLFFFCFVFFQR